ncbi:hypothetical protein [Rheinheimera gaetbuli]
MTQLAGFISAIATNPALQAAFASNPQNTMADYGLTSIEVAAVLQGDKNAVEILTGATQQATAYFFFDAPARSTH